MVATDPSPTAPAAPAASEPLPWPPHPSTQASTPAQLQPPSRASDKPQPQLTASSKPQPAASRPPEAPLPHSPTSVVDVQLSPLSPCSAAEAAEWEDLLSSLGPADGLAGSLTEARRALRRIDNSQDLATLQAAQSRIPKPPKQQAAPGKPQQQAGPAAGKPQSTLPPRSPRLSPRTSPRSKPGIGRFGPIAEEPAELQAAVQLLQVTERLKASQLSAPSASLPPQVGATKVLSSNCQMPRAVALAQEAVRLSTRDVYAETSRILTCMCTQQASGTQSAAPASSRDEAASVPSAAATPGLLNPVLQLVGLLYELVGAVAGFVDGSLELGRILLRYPGHILEVQPSALLRPQLRMPCGSGWPCNTSMFAQAGCRCCDGIRRSYPARLRPAGG